MLGPNKKNPTSKELRAFGFVILVGFGLIGFLLFKKGHMQAAQFVWGGSLLVFLITLTILPLANLIYKAWMLVGKAIGSVTNRIVLALVYYLVLTPIAFTFRIVGRDNLQLKKNKNKSTCWVDLPIISDNKALIERYKHLF